MTRYSKRDFPVSEIRRFLEPGPVVLVSSRWKDETNIMTMGWHMVMESDPSLVGCYIWTEDYSRQMIRKSRECVINIPTIEIATKVVRIGNTSGRDIDKFARFKLTPVDAEKVKAHAAISPKFPRTIHYRGDGLFMIAGPTTRRYRRLFKPKNL